MIVRILNKKEDRDSDRFYDCRNSCLAENEKRPKELLLTLEFTSGKSIEIVLISGDRIYYMNDTGKTIHSDCRMV